MTVTDEPAQPSSVDVGAFILARQPVLLEHARTALEQCRDEDLPSEVHRLIGTLGAYRLDTAVAVLMSVEELLASVNGSSDVAHARRLALAAVIEH